MPLTTVAYRPYRLNVPFVLATRVDFAQLIKVYASINKPLLAAKIISADKFPWSAVRTKIALQLRIIERLNWTRCIRSALHSLN